MDTMIKRVWVGDLCYVLSDERWDKLCDQIFADSNSKACFSNDALSLCGTCYGDGVYEGDYTSYPVDSGTLGVIWEDAMDNKTIENSGRFFIVNVKNSPKLSANYDNVTGDIEIMVGSEVIEKISTNPEYYDIDEDEDDDFWTSEDENSDEDE